MNNEIINTILSQLKSLGVIEYRGQYDLIKIDDNTLRLHKRGRSVDISYNEGTDLYDCKIHVVNRRAFEVKTTEHKDMFVENLKSLFVKA